VSPDNRASRGPRLAKAEVNDLPDDLRSVIDTWESLLEAVKAGMVAMVKAVQPP
jgi:hypothetical protein